jgi:glycerol kinase
VSKHYIISIDQSTQGTKAMLIDEDGHVAAYKAVSHRQIIDSAGHVEHDPVEIASNLFSMVRDLVTGSGIDRKLIAGVGVANQRETVAVWNRKTGKPIFNAIVWQCNRASGISERLEKEGLGEMIHQITGLKLSPFFSGPKIAWILENVPGARELAERGELCCGTMDCWVIYNLTEGKCHKTDFSNASRMMLMDLNALAWSPEACRMFNIPMSMLPEICDSDSLFGYTTFNGLFDNPIPIHGDAGDSHAALFAQGCFEKGSCMTGYGTGSCVMMNLGSKPILSRHGLLTSVAWKTKEGINFAYDGVINYSGAVISWLCNDLGLVSKPSETEAYAYKANPGDRTILVPAFTGIGAPHWSDAANAVLWGMTRSTGKAEICKAVLESIGYQVADVVRAMVKDCGSEINYMGVSGGPSKNNYLMQFQSDIIGCDIGVPSNEEMTCLGAAFISGIALGLTDRAQISKAYDRKVFKPVISDQNRLECIDRWNLAVKQALCR